MYLFVRLRQVLAAACRTFCSPGALYLRLAGSALALLGLSCSMACGISVFCPEIEPRYPVLQGGFLTTGLLGKSQKPFLSLLGCSFLGASFLGTCEKTKLGGLVMWEKWGASVTISTDLPADSWDHLLARRLGHTGHPAQLMSECKSVKNLEWDSLG